MHRLIDTQLASLNLNTRLFLNCLDGLSEDQARVRIEGVSNNVSFIAAHVIDARHFLARTLGSEAASPFGEELAAARSIEDVKDAPTLAALRHAWADVTHDLIGRVAEVTEADLEKKAEQEFPTEDDSLIGEIAFLLHHESYHIGQLALLRKQLGHPAMSYGERDDEAASSEA
jgi:uncharacterized damage-inducible protein DinB